MILPEKIVIKVILFLIGHDSLGKEGGLIDENHKKKENLDYRSK